MAFSVSVDGKPVRADGRLPLLPLRDIVLFPGMSLPLFVGRVASIAAVEKACGDGRLIFAVAQRRPEVSVPRRSDLYETGVVAHVQQVLRLPDGTIRVLLQGLARARGVTWQDQDTPMQVEVGPGPREARASEKTLALLRRVQAGFFDYARLNQRVPEAAVIAATSSQDPVQTSYLIASHLLLKVSARQELLEAPQAAARLQLLTGLLATESELEKLERRVDSRMPHALSTDGRTGGGRGAREGKGDGGREPDEGATELAELEEKIQRARLPEPVMEKARREIERLSKMAFLSPEATVCRTYLDWLVALPWHKRTRERAGLAEAERILNEDHHGLLPVKERILEQISIMHLSKKVRGPVLCLLGPPGVGKTSLGQSVARALGRRFVRMSLGGVRDEAEVRGHRRTYIGAMPGRIVQAMRRAGVINPVILLDEVDKLGLDYRGDPSAALLEVLDPEQNRAFNDHYLEVDYDLSRVLFLTTANSAAGIPPALRDRMEVISLPGYLETEKLAIAERFLLAKQRTACGLESQDLTVTAPAFVRVIREYTREAGVRGLEREIARICRRAARRKAFGKWSGAATVGREQVEEFLGTPRYMDQPAQRRARVGLAIGLAWSEVGGSILQIEAGVLPGRGKLILTGNLGSTLRESAQAALSCVRSRALDLGLPADFNQKIDIHVHIPEGEVPKDGPSAGVAIALALVSALTEIPTRRCFAVTGELTLQGQVLPIGGLAEKAVAALRSGIKTILIPAANRRTWDDLPEEVRQKLRVVPVSSVEEVLRRGLVRRFGEAQAHVRPPTGRIVHFPKAVTPKAMTPKVVTRARSRTSSVSATRS
jgi:ATP-dependent Lon protease